MKQIINIVVFCLALSLGLTAQSGMTVERGKLAIPLAFTENRGQVHSSVLYYAKTGTYNIGVTKQGLIFNDGSQLRFLGANSDVAVRPVGNCGSKANFFRGNDPKGWITNVNAYPAIRYRELYPGVDLEIYGNDRDIEYDWIVKPGADPKQIRFIYNHVQQATLDSEGNLHITTSSNRLLHRRPIAYQIIDGKKTNVNASFRQLRNNTFGLATGPYDTNRQLVIDPLITRFATYLGGTGTQDLSYCLTVDNSGFIYICGATDSNDFPTTSPIQPYKSNGLDGYVCKIDPKNSRLLFSTYIGGNRDDWNIALSLDQGGSIYISGVTYSTDFPLKDPFQGYNAGDADAYVFKLSSTGDQLLYSTYLGGTYYDSGKQVKLDQDDNIYVTGLAWMNFPLKNNAMDYAGGGDVFVTKLVAGGQSLVYSTYVGGYTYDTGTDLIIEDDGAVVVTGYTRSSNFPIVNGLQPVFGGYRDSLLFKLSPNGNTLLFSSYLGGEQDDHLSAIEKGTDGYYYLTGSSSSANFPIKNAWQNKKGGNYDAVLACVDLTTPQMIFATFLGGADADYGRHMEFGANGRLILLGSTSSHDFPLKNPLQETLGGVSDLFISQFDPTAQILEYSTYLGGIGEEQIPQHGTDMDDEGNLYLFCHSTSTDMEVMNPIQGMNRGGFDVYVAKLELDDAPSVEIVEPEDGDEVAGLVEIDIEAEDDVGVVMVNVYIDDELQHTDLEAPYGYHWDSSMAVNGPHRVKAEAIDTMGFGSTHQIEVQVRNAAITLNAQRQNDRGWLVRKTCGVLEFEVRKPEGIPITSYDIFRRDLGGNFQKIGNLTDSKPDLLIQRHQFIDPTLTPDRTCWYCVHAVSDSGETLGISNSCQL